MIKIENIETFNLEGAIRGMRNPMNSWDKSDSYMCDEKHCGGKCCREDTIDEKNCTQPDGYHIGKNDLELMRRLYKAGHPHRKYLRQIMVCVDITAPLYWWKEFDTYKVGTTSNSCSTMHKIHAKEFTLDDFSHDNLMYTSLELLKVTIEKLNYWRDIYINGGSSDEDPTGTIRRIFNPKDKYVWWQLIQLLPSSYNQKRTITMNYENIVNMLEYRQGHKLDEWNNFCKIMIDNLPYLKQIIED